MCPSCSRCDYLDAIYAAKREMIRRDWGQDGWVVGGVDCSLPASGVGHKALKRTAPFWTIRPFLSLFLGGPGHLTPLPGTQHLTQFLETDRPTIQCNSFWDQKEQCSTSERQGSYFVPWRCEEGGGNAIYKGKFNCTAFENSCFEEDTVCACCHYQREVSSQL